MRVLDLLQLLQDYPANTPVHIKGADATQNIATFQAEDGVFEQPQLIIIPKADGKPLKCWELILLLNQPQWRQRFLYVQMPDEVRPLFGLQERAAGLILN